MSDVPLRLSSLAAYKTFAKVPGNDQDSRISALLYSLSARIARYLGRASGTSQFVENKSRTETHDVKRGQSRWTLRAVPVDSVTSVSWDIEGTFGSGTALGTDDYEFNPDSGEIRIRYILHTRAWPDVYTQSLRVVYVGGIAASLQALQSYAPDLELALQMQMKHELSRTEHGPEERSVSGAAGTVSHPEMKLTAEVKELLAPYRLEGLGI